MREALRLSYLEALGVSNWVPRRSLANAATRQPALLEPLPVTADHGESADHAVKGLSRDVPSGAAQGPAAVREMVKAPSPRIAAEQPAPEPAPPAASMPAVAPFYLQLWQAGSCAVLLEIDEPGLEAGTAAYRLFNDILRAADLPAPHLLADFRWPLIRNQADRSGAAASLGLQAFVQARLEERAMLSLGCFGSMATLLAEGDVDKARLLYGREEAIEGLPPVWFSPGLEQLMSEPQLKARLWTLIKRIKSRWTQSNG